MKVTHAIQKYSTDDSLLRVVHCGHFGRYGNHFVGYLVLFFFRFSDPNASRFEVVTR